MCSVNVFQWYLLDSQSSEKRHTEIGCLLRCFTFGWPLNGSEAGGELVNWDTDLIAFVVWIKLFQCKPGHFRDKSREVCIKQSKFNSSSAAIQKPGHWAENCKTVYCANKKIVAVRFLSILPSFILAFGLYHYFSNQITCCISSITFSVRTKLYSDIFALNYASWNSTLQRLRANLK